MGNKVCTRYNYCTKDSETGVRNEIDSFLITGVDENRMQEDKDYRRKFVDEILKPSRLKNARNVPMFPYVGSFTEFGKYESDIELTLAFREITDGAR